MLYVHALMGDARPGEVDPSALNETVERIYSRVARDAARYHGPYRLELRMPAPLQVGERGTATIRVLSAGGNALPNVEVALDAGGASGVPGEVRTNANGVATVTFTATSAEDVELTARAGGLPSTLPRIFTADDARGRSERTAAGDCRLADRDRHPRHERLEEPRRRRVGRGSGRARSPAPRAATASRSEARPRASASR